MKDKILEYLFNTENHTDKDSEFYISPAYLKQTIGFIKELAVSEKFEKLKHEFSEEFLNEFLLSDPEFHAIFNSLLNGESPYKAIERLCRSKKKLNEALQRVVESKPIPVKVTYPIGEIINVDNLVIEGCDNASGFRKTVSPDELESVALEIYKEHPGERGYYDFTKYLWVKYPDGSEKRLDNVVPYPEDDEK